MELSKKQYFLSKINIVPRWIIFVIDLGVTFSALLLAFIVKQNLTLVGINWESLFTTVSIMLIVNAFVFTALKTYSGIVRYTGMQDALRIAFSVLASSVVFNGLGHTINNLSIQQSGQNEIGLFSF